MKLHKLNILLFVTHLLIVLSGKAQEASGDTKLYLFTDREYSISGDTVWFKVALQKAADEKSNVFHVQLGSPDNSLVSKIIKKSKNGWGEGYIHIPDSLSTGVYFLTAFLNSQRNITDLVVESQALFVYNRFSEGVPEMKIPVQQFKVESDDFSQKIEININKTEFAAREKVEVNLDFTGIAGNEIENVIVKATRLDNLANENGGKFRFRQKPANQYIPFLQEKDGFILSGKVIQKASGNPKAGAIVLLSLTGDPLYFDYCVSGSDGDFNFFLKQAEGLVNVVLQAVSANGGEMVIQIGRNYLAWDQEIEFQPKTLTQNQSEIISTSVNGSFFNKLFNENYNTKPEGFSMPARFSVPFYGPPKSRVILADFIDLPDFREISRELLPGVQYRVNNSEITFRLLNEIQGAFFEHEPLRLINGIPVFKNNLFSLFGSSEIEYVDFILQERLFGDLIFKGVLAVSLFDKSNGWLAGQPNIYQFSIACLQPDKSPGYSVAKEGKPNIPDIRQVGFFEIIPTGVPHNFEFYLSDLKGKIEISVEGVTKNNELFKASKIIEVK